MEEFASLEVKSMPIERQCISTTGITKLEASCFDLPPEFILSSVLTPQTKALVTYKALFTEKHLQALIWNIPIIYISYLYDPSACMKKYELKPFQGAIFSSSGVSEEIFINFLTQNGAIYEPNVSIYIDFLISDNEDSEKSKFCLKYGIPIIKTSQIFSNNFILYKKNIKYDAKQLKAKALFFEKTFYIDPKLPKRLFNKIRRVIVENEGVRVSAIGDDTTFIITHDHAQFIEFRSKLIHYQYIFDCVESKAILHFEFYKFNFSNEKQILLNMIAVVDKAIPNITEYINKLKALGSTVKTRLDARATHYITQNHNLDCIATFHKNYTVSSQKSKDKLNEDGFPFKIVTPEWIDQCLTALKNLKESRYSPGRPILSLKKRNSIKKERETLFQFTGLPAFFKNEAIAKLESFEIKFTESDKFENCTHLVMGSLNSSEKLFCAIVSGCWILKPDFIQDFQNEQNFDFEKYEWRSNETMSSKEKKIVNSIRKWRVKVQNEQIRPFSRWNVKIYASPNKLENFKNLIICGGGLLNEQLPYTHVFVDREYKGEVLEEKHLVADSIFSYLFK